MPKQHEAGETIGALCISNAGESVVSEVSRAPRSVIGSCEIWGSSRSAYSRRAKQIRLLQANAVKLVVLVENSR